MDPRYLATYASAVGSSLLSLAVIVIATWKIARRIVSRDDLGCPYCQCAKCRERWKR